MLCAWGLAAKFGRYDESGRWSYFGDLVEHSFFELEKKMLVGLVFMLKNMVDEIRKWGN